jgi:hypothetical protein
MTAPRPLGSTSAGHAEDRQRMDYTPPVLAHARGGPVPPYQPIKSRRDGNARRPP